MANFGNAPGQQVVGDLALHRLRQDNGGRAHRGIGRRRTDVGDRLGLGQRDLALGGLGPPRDEVFQLGLGFGRDALGLRLGTVDDVPRLALGDLYVFYIGFDPQALKPEPKPRVSKKK